MNIPKGRLLTTLAILAAFTVLAGITAVAASDRDDSQPRNLPAITPPIPTPEYTEQELKEKVAASREAWKSHIPVITGTPLQMPDDAKFDGLVGKSQQRPVVINGKTIEPLELPIYIIVRNGEVANISRDTGAFMIAENQKDTFQFLIDQLGEDKMQLIDNDFYEERWGPFRADALEEGK